jgi:outer membrane receptor protein involved in Fe transport
MGKGSFHIILAVISGIVFIFGEAASICAQQSQSNEFTLEEITVTAEKRAVNIQTIPASVQALEGTDLVDQGKATVAQMLENVPNLVWAAEDTTNTRGGPNDNITIRGIKSTQNTGGPGPIPSATSTYVDGVFAGTGGDYDIDRIEVLRGPQGTLYGRSATGGVVAFYTKNPKLGEFSGNVTAEYGSGSRINTQGAINVPVGDKVALRAAVRYLHQEEGYRLDDKGGGSETKEGRIKALFQPTEQFSALLILSAEEAQAKTGGWTYALTAPNKIVYKGYHTDVFDDIPSKYKQGSLELNYNLGDSALTYIAAMHTMEHLGKGGAQIRNGSAVVSSYTGEPAKTQTHEIRWASNTEGPLSWLIGGNYYKYTYQVVNQVLQHRLIGDDDPNTFDAPLFGQWLKGDITDYGLFTEDTYKLRDDMRITAGLRYDKTKVNTLMGYDFNLAMKANGAALNPPNNLHFPTGATYTEVSPDFDNVTYKLRFEYDLTPENMLYALTATGFLPGTSAYVTAPTFGPLPTGGFGVTNVDFIPYIFKQEKLTSYEVGSKNRFMDKRLQVNVAAFYMNYQGYQEAINISPPGQPPPGVTALLRLPVRIIGLETDASWLLTQYDKVTLTAGWLDAEAKKYPPVDTSLGVVSAKQFMVLKRIPGLPDVTANLVYDHTFLFGDGSSLVPRAELRYTSGYYLGQVTELEKSKGYLPYLYQDSVVLLNLSATWSSAKDKYSITGYIRNATDKEYKTSVGLPIGSQSATATVGDPRTYGIMVSVKF